MADYTKVVAESGSMRSLADAGDVDAAMEQLVQEAVVVNDVSSDCWGALEFVIINDIPDIFGHGTSREQKVRIFFGVMVFVLNIFIQFTLLFFIVTRLLLPAFLSTQDLYKHFHFEAFHKGSFSLERFEDHFTKGETDKICGLAIGHATITKILLFLWVSTNVGEVWKSYERFLLIYRHPPLPAGADLHQMCRDVHETETHGHQFWVICLTPGTKVLLQCLVHIPKMFIATVLGFTGSLWLLASESFGDLILNSLALAFVTSVDELIAGVFFPPCFDESVVGLQYRSKVDPKSSTEEGSEELRVRSYLINYGKLFFAFVAVQLLYTYQPVVPGFGHDLDEPCRPFLLEQVPWCWPGSTDCFPTEGQ